MSSFDDLISQKKSLSSLNSLVIDMNSRLSKNLNINKKKHQPWESKKHFWVGFGEMALLEFLPFAFSAYLKRLDRCY
jgi:hypothetical protein